MRLIILFIISMTMVSFTGRSQYCMDAGPTSIEDSNLSSFNLIGESFEINYEGCPGVIGVDDQTVQVADLISLSTYVFEVNWGTCNRIIDCAGSAWIDFNNNDEFEPTELFFSQENFEGGLLSIEYEITMPFMPTGDYRLRIMEMAHGELPLDPCATFENGSITDFTIRIIDAPSCPAPSRLTLDELSYNSAEISWTEGGDEREWYIDWGISGFVPGESDPRSTIFSYLEFIDLEPKTSYDFYVKAICAIGDSSIWRGPYTFETKCRPAVSPYFCENFEDTSATLNCWTILNENGDGDEFSLNFTEYPRSGLKSAGINTNLNEGNNDDWLISPPIELTDNGAATFWVKVSNSFEPNIMEVLLSTTGTDPDDFTETVLERAVYNNSIYEKHVIDLTDYTGVVYIGFHIPTDGLDGSKLFIDDVCFGKCMPTPSENDTLDICITEDYLDLRTVIDIRDTDGVWTYQWDPDRVVSDHFFDMTDIAAGEYELFFISEGMCDKDTTIAYVRVLEELDGSGGTLTVCMKEPVNLFSGLVGVEINTGAWTFEDGSPLPTPLFVAPEEVGSTNYLYTYDNGACPEITVSVTLIIEDCKYVAIDNITDAKFIVYPNPAREYLFIEIKNHNVPMQLELLDISGKTILQLNESNWISNQLQINIKNLTDGTYFIRLIDNESVYTSPIIISK